MSEPVRLRPDMACCHGDDGKANCEALREEVRAALECEPGILITAVVMDLQHQYDVSITSILADMWSGISSEWRDGSEVTAWIECDRVEDGFALTWKTWKEWFEKREQEEK